MLLYFVAQTVPTLSTGGWPGRGAVCQFATIIVVTLAFQRHKPSIPF